MLELKGKKKFFFLLVLFLLFTTYGWKSEIFTFLNIKKIIFINDNNLEENVKYEVINYLNKKNLFNIENDKLTLYFDKSQWIKSFKINKKYPNELKITIFEYKPIAILKKKNKLYFINDSFEVTNKLVNQRNNQNLIYIEGNYKKDLFKDIYFKLVNFEFYNEIKNIKLLNLDRWELQLKNNIYVKLGNYEILNQLNTLEKIINKYKNLKYVDLRNKGRVIINEK